MLTHWNLRLLHQDGRSSAHARASCDSFDTAFPLAWPATATVATVFFPASGFVPLPRQQRGDEKKSSVYYAACATTENEWKNSVTRTSCITYSRPTRAPAQSLGTIMSTWPAPWHHRWGCQKWRRRKLSLMGSSVYDDITWLEHDVICEGKWCSLQEFGV